MTEKHNTTNLGWRGALIGAAFGLLLTVGVWSLFDFMPSRSNNQTASPGSSVLSSDGNNAADYETLSSFQPKEADKAYACSRVASVQVRLEDLKGAISTIRNINDTSEQDEALKLLFQTLRQDRVFEPLYDGYAPEPGISEELARKLKNLHLIAQEIEDNALRAGVFARLADLRIELNERVSSTDTVSVEELISEAKQAAFSVQSKTAGNDLIPKLGIFVTAVTTLLGFLVSSFVQSALAEYGKTVAARISKPTDTDANEQTATDQITAT